MAIHHTLSSGPLCAREAYYAACQAKNAWQLRVRLQEYCRSWDFRELLSLLCKARKLRRLSGVGILEQQGFIAA